MAPLKFEEQLRDKLENRKLQPSENAWEQLSNRLNKAENKKNTKTYWWLGLAASLIGIVLIASQFLNRDVTIIPENNVVINPDFEVINDNESSAKIASEEVQFETSQPTSVELPNDKKVTEQPATNNLIIPNNSNSMQMALINEDVKTIDPVSKSEYIKVTPTTLSFEEQKIQDVVAQFEALKNNNQNVTEAEIDALLLKAQNDIKLNKLANETSKLVDANLLLQDVEAELDQSFRNKVFEAIKSSYNSVKTAVAQRNN